MSFHCPRCDGNTSVIDVRAELRRRRCKSCTYTFSTQETELEDAVPFDRRQKWKWTAARERRLTELWARGLRGKVIARELGTSLKAIQNKAYRLGLPAQSEIREAA